MHPQITSRPIMNSNFAAETEEISELEFTHHADSADISSTGFEWIFRPSLGLGYANFWFISKYRHRWIQLVVLWLVKTTVGKYTWRCRESPCLAWIAVRLWISEKKGDISESRRLALPEPFWCWPCPTGRWIFYKRQWAQIRNSIR